LTRSETYIQIP